MEDMGALWDKIVAASTPSLASTTASAPSPVRTCRLALSSAPDPIHLPETPRRAGLIDPVLRERIRGCVRGELPWPLLVWGPAGRGKTCAALALLDHVPAHRTARLYYVAAGWSAETIEAQQDRLVWEWHEQPSGSPQPQRCRQEVGVARLRRYAAEARLVVLDELAAREKVSDHHYDCVKELLDARHAKPLVLLSNHPLSRIAELYDDRVASRMAAGTVVELKGTDRRLAR